MQHDDWGEEFILSQVPCFLQASNAKQLWEKNITD